MRFELADYKDIAARTYLEALRKMQTDIVDIFDQLHNKAKYTEFLVAIKNIESFIMEDGLYYGKSINKVMSFYDQALKELKMFAEIPEANLQALKAIEHQSMINKAKVDISTIQKTFIESAITKTWDKKAILETLKTTYNGATGYWRTVQGKEKYIKFTEKQINSFVETELTTALGDFEGNVTESMMAEMPDDSKYIYVGPQDEKTRDVCVAMGSAGALTKKEIKSRWGEYAVKERGGRNCRHVWELSV